METIVGKPFKLQQILKGLNQEKDYELKEHHQKRSLSQNSYCWKLVSELADVLRVSKDEVYLEMLKAYGQSMMMSMNSTIKPSQWFKYYEVVDITPNEEKIVYRVFRGSSTYDSREMSIFIDGIIRECENVGISTLTPEEIAKLNLI